MGASPVWRTSIQPFNCQPARAGWSVVVAVVVAATVVLVGVVVVLVGVLSITVVALLVVALVVVLGDLALVVITLVVILGDLALVVITLVVIDFFDVIGLGPAPVTVGIVVVGLFDLCDLFVVGLFQVDLKSMEIAQLIALELFNLVLLVFGDDGAGLLRRRGVPTSPRTGMSAFTKSASGPPRCGASIWPDQGSASSETRSSFTRCSPCGPMRRVLPISRSARPG